MLNLLFSWKKNVSRLITILSFLLMHCCVTAQQRYGQHLLFNKIADTISQPFNTARPYYIGVWEKNIPASVKRIRQLDENTAIIEVTSQPALDSLRQQIRIAAANDRWKYSPYAERMIQNDNTEQQQYILCASDIYSLLNILKSYKSQLAIVAVDEPSNTVLVKTTPAVLTAKLLSLKEIIFADLRAGPRSEISIIGYNRSFHGINAVDYSIPGANGKNIVAGVKEQKMEEADLDLYKRVLISPIASANVSNHATVISSIIGGAGNSFYDGRGIAYACTFFPSTFSNLFADDATILNANKVFVQNHSYGTVVQQFYGAEAVSYDMQAWQNKNIVAVFSSGNSGNTAATDGQYASVTGYANLTGNFKMAKNIITVGAIDNKGIVAPESSAGPLYDGRIAPQLVALGPGGTSDAAAVVTGTIAVMQQVFSDSNNQSLPVSSLIKAVLYNTAEDIYRAGIDYKTGYGLLNSFAAIKSIQQKEFDSGSLMQGQQWIKTISLPANIAQLKVTLAWTDSAATVNNNKALINDLDLQVMQVSNSTVFRPWVLSTAADADSLGKLPSRKRDSLNTAEQVSILLPAAGNYQLKVTGTSIINSPVSFNIAYHADTLNTFHFTSPQHTSDVNRQENPDLDVRWKTFVADTNQTGNLYISYDSGLNWQLVKGGQKLYTNYLQWPIKDTSSRAVFKMETSFGDFLSKEFVITNVTRVNVDFLCDDSMRLSWQKHIYAGSYNIYTLTDSAYLKKIVSVVDTFIVLKRGQYPWFVYAVEPVLNNNLPAARSVAIDIRASGVNCFYKTLYYNLPGPGKLELVLELSTTGYVDSIIFERVTANGQLLQTVGKTVVNNNSTIYSQLTDDVPPGTSYWRAAIKLKNGSIVYTDIISMITSGKKYILFYPNPVDRNSTLAYLLQQNLPTDSKLQLFDISGRFLRSYSEIPNSVNLKTFSAGVIIYKLYSRDNRLLETGKLIIR